ncbi:Hypothetical protein SMAX5B_015789 [Scophthalmus maximus]|uniref:Uncharacterized protein n=1 Tax=Scophthalmus maximus TaxID=52904 RepID=A0A2U9CYF9_SCOMX|nr:Hypothetical protein SMAX5B_015789 [Scophthalmus maximus]
MSGYIVAITQKVSLEPQSRLDYVFDVFSVTNCAAAGSHVLSVREWSRDICLQVCWYGQGFILLLWTKKHSSMDVGRQTMELLKNCKTADSKFVICQKSIRTSDCHIVDCSGN